MLSRSAEGLYWMGRSFERVSHLSRLLRIQTESLVDRPLREIHFGWRRIYESLHRRPPGGALHLHRSDSYTLADAYTLADNLTFEPANPDSIRNCLAASRENARQMRHCLSAQMWTEINRCYLKMKGVEISDIWISSPESFYAEAAADIDTLTGVAAATLYRDERWLFLRLGRFVERTQLCASLLAAQIDASRFFEAGAETDWTGLLRVYYAFDAYNRSHGAEVTPGRVLDLLATDVQLPGSLTHSITVTGRTLSRIGAGPGGASDARCGQAAERLGALVGAEWPGGGRRELLNAVGAESREMHDAITGAYFDYPIEGAPGR